MCMLRPLILVILFILLVHACADKAKAATVTAQSWIVADGNGQIITGTNPDQVRPIASITKLLTVMIVIDANQPMDEVLYRKSTRAELINLALVKSDNNAASVLCNQYPDGYNECIHMMNRKANELFMTSTYVREPTGLDADNVSTASDLIKLVRAASEYPVIVTASQISQITSNAKRHVVKKNTNPLVGHGYDFIVSKTGFINKSGGCIVANTLTKLGERTFVILGSRNTHTRIIELKHLIDATNRELHENHRY